MKENAVRLSGVVYVKDPRDLEALTRLRKEITELRREARSSERKMRPYQNLAKANAALKRREKRVERIESILRQRHRTIMKLKDMKLGVFLNDRQGFWYQQNDELNRLKP